MNTTFNLTMEQSQQLIIINECQQGNWSNFGQLYDYYIKRIYSFVYYKTSHKETAEDLVSQTFMKAVSRISQYYADKGTFSSWLYQIAENTVIDHYRKQKPAENIDDVWDLQANINIEEEVEHTRELEELKKYLDILTPEQRKIIVLRVWDELSYKEISEIVNKSEDNCKMIYSRALKSIKNKVPISVLLLLLLQI